MQARQATTAKNGQPNVADLMGALQGSIALKSDAKDPDEPKRRKIAFDGAKKAMARNTKPAQ